MEDFRLHSHKPYYTDSLLEVVSALKGHHLRHTEIKWRECLDYGVNEAVTFRAASSSDEHGLSLRRSYYIPAKMSVDGMRSTGNTEKRFARDRASLRTPPTLW